MNEIVELSALTGASVSHPPSHVTGSIVEEGWKYFTARGGDDKESVSCASL